MPTMLITGATAGIGEAAAEKFAAAGYRLILTGRRRGRLDALAARLPAETLALCFDVRDPEAVRAALDSLPAEWQQVDLLLNNAGLAAGLSPIHEGLLSDWEQMIDTNLKGLLYLTRAIAPQMVARRSGHIINIGSIAGKEAYLNGNVYCATKHAVDALTRCMRMDLVPYGIKVSNVAPGMVETEFSQVRFKGDTARAGKVYEGLQPLTAADIADVIYFVATCPPHVTINDILVMPTAQASVAVVHRQP
ncbi:MAG: SDR family NAD(P)-dependent oxidoreductase [Bacteroidia bacterium]|nr:SDR family NAD(P)-dependent oxidoreductase [Bacteroidia bacterium]